MYEHLQQDKWRGPRSNARRKLLRRGVRGQALVEYTFIIVLVAVGVIVAAGLIGLAVERVYGVVSGALGTTYKTSGTHVIEITDAECVVFPTQTGLWVFGRYQNENVADLVGSTDKTVGTGENGDLYPVQADSSPSGFKWMPLLAQTANPAVCPKSVVIQSKDGSIAVSPITIAIK